jgi:regulator of nucleoside diphosphate kinase
MATNRANPLPDEWPAAHVLPWVLPPEAASVPQGLLDQALVCCAEKMHLRYPEAALALLREGSTVACSFVRHSLAEQVAEILGNRDDTVQSVFIFDVDATPSDAACGELALTSPLHLIVRTRRKTEALRTLVRVLQRALLEEYTSRVGPSQVEYLLNVQVIDPDDVEKRRGYAGLLNSLFNRPIQVWQREEQEHADKTPCGWLLDAATSDKVSSGAEPMTETNERTLLVTVDDLGRLRKLIDRAKLRDPRDSEYLDRLEGELSAARAVASARVPSDVVTMNSTVHLLDLDTAERLIFTLVFPDEADIDNAKVSVLAPIGTAVLGYRAGDRLSWQVPDGVRRLKVVEVLYQPEASGDGVR